MTELDLIQQFEDEFIKAGKLAMHLKSKAISNIKSQTGVSEIDIVTSADLEVQEYILSRLANSSLKNCELVAEEDTPSVKKFAKSSNLVITLDPIDGTLIYSKGGKIYSTIVTIHDKKKPVYTFDYFPELDWGVKIVKDKVEFFGKMPEVDIKIEGKTVIAGFALAKERLIEEKVELYEQLKEDGYTIKDKKQINPDSGGTFMFLNGIGDGYYMQDGSAVDCFVVLHYAMARGLKIIKDIDLKKPIKSNDLGGSARYKGYYLVLR